ncbi:MAG: hypothetical protein ABJF11_04630 [Reichenbachiella sp.]|uniref:hypothetical protein n=1 Tax=Reichenbachiella sp. TaxID=2184521 RepID=UPI0032664870
MKNTMSIKMINYHLSPDMMIKKIVATLCFISFGVAALAQASSYDNGQINVEVDEVIRIEKYGWENLELSYQLTNGSDRQLKRIDFKVILLDKDQKSVGEIDVHDFNIPENSKITYKYIEMNPDFVNARIDEIKLVEGSIAVQYNGSNQQTDSGGKKDTATIRLK